MFTRRRIIIAAIIFVVLITGLSIYGATLFAKRVPNEFTEARMKGALVAIDIVSVSNSITADLQKVNELEAQKKKEEALALVASLRTKSDQLRPKAQEMTTDLEVMAKTIPLIKSEEAKREAMEAVDNYLALIVRLVNYSGYLGELVVNVGERLEGAPTPSRVQELVAQINAEVETINTFNRQADAAMARFDDIVKKQ